ncbi:MAG: ABC transporter permease [Rhodospirillales bacterium]|nr:ABC transporter permease [Rhodospirillales bacterium]
MTDPMTGAAPSSGSSPWLQRAAESDMLHSFRRSRLAQLSASITLLFLLTAILAPLLAPYNPYDLSQVSLMDSLTPPVWADGGSSSFLLGTDDQGRDILSTIMYGARISIFVGLASVALAASLGVPLGLLAGYAGGAADAIIMRLADIQLTFPAILIALLIDGIANALLGGAGDSFTSYAVLTLSIALASWVQFARTVRGSTLVEKNKEYVQAARIIGRHPLAIMIRHVLPNAMGPVLVIATVNLALAIILEATLSFLGVGVPITEPSLGTLIRVGNDFLFSGEWWITFFPGLALAVLALSVNLLGDWLRDALNPKLR